ncbi:hypothetical protein BU17DRAFT_64299 [Hysterangium stoloniferum]|nr:hypothetical protein BU17DRAFT_64299 [Hysterangium stoloniferum]
MAPRHCGVGLSLWHASAECVQLGEEETESVCSDPGSEVENVIMDSGDEFDFERSGPEPSIGSVLFPDNLVIWQISYAILSPSNLTTVCKGLGQIIEDKQGSESQKHVPSTSGNTDTASLKRKRCPSPSPLPHQRRAVYSPSPEKKPE